MLPHSNLFFYFHPDTYSMEKSLKRCCAEDCRKKLLLTDFNCRCGKRYCPTHRAPETHMCTFDFRAQGQAILEKQLIKCSGNHGMTEKV